MPSFPHIEGLIAAPHTPFAADGSVEYETVIRQVGFLSTQGLSGVFVNGTTGEGLSLTSAERRRILETWIEHAPEDLRVIAHVGHHSVREAAALASHAAATGAYGISTMGPSFLKPASTTDLVRFCKPIADTAGDLPFYYYHIPGLSGVNVPMPEFLELGARSIGNLAGIKYTHGDLFEYQRCRAVCDGMFDMLWGVDEILLGALAVGAVGAVGSTYNYAAPIYLEMIERFAAGDLDTARSRSREAVRLVETLIEFDVLAAGKTIMSLHGIDCGSPRPPVVPLSAQCRDDLLSTITSLGLITTAGTPA